MQRRKPASLRKRSFGGQNGVGIWWRKRGIPNSVQTESEHETLGSEAEASTDVCSTCSSANESPREINQMKAPRVSLDTTTERPLIGWDDDLCRPIYYQRTVSSARSSLMEDDDDDDTTEDFVVMEDSPVKNTSETVSGFAYSKENKDLMGMDDTSVNNNERSHLPEATDDSPFQIPPLTRKRTKTFGNRAKRQRPVSLIMTEDQHLVEDTKTNIIDFDGASRRISLDSGADRSLSNAREFSTKRGESDPPRENYHSLHGSPPEKVKRLKVKNKERRQSKRLRSDCSSSLETAREYFANLDQTQVLTLDTTSSPAVSSMITRTSRRTNFNSPGIKRSYRAYVESIRADGLSPLSIRDFASSRRMHFEKKGEIVDGFLDEE